MRVLPDHLLSAIVSALVLIAPVLAQTPTASPGAQTPAAVVPQAVVKAPARRCMRLPLSDIAVGRPETVSLAQLRLGEYAVKEAQKRGWVGPLAKSDETVQCEDYLYLPLIGQEYKCFVTATFCAK